MPYKVYLKKNEDKRIRDGHPWVYANEVSHIDSDGRSKNGDLAEVYDFKGEYIGKGYINHLSKILVRIFIRNNSEPTLEFFKERIRIANDYRLRLGYSNCYRMVFAEADDLPALIVDKYHDLLCIQILSLGMELNKATIIKALVELFNPRGIYERSDVPVREKEGLSQYKGVVYGTFDPKVIIEENGLKMYADLENGQKTGYFLDQKENRLSIRRYSHGATVLDCFCNVGGFSLNAAFAGAKEVTAVDISEKTLSDVVENARINHLDNVVRTLCGDVFDVLRDLKKSGKEYDLVILDPPAFCKNTNDVKNAYRGYKDINILGMKLVKPGGILVSASCSHYMTPRLFEDMLKDASKESKKRVRIVDVRSQSPDHPALLAADETTYLKLYVMQVM